VTSACDKNNGSILKHPDTNLKAMFMDGLISFHIDYATMLLLLWY